jgi:glucose 1-dehydrogenase
MQAVAVFPSKRELKLIECDEPRITAPTQVKLRMLDVGICGTDKEIVRFEYGAPPAGSDYLILGHEALGEVVEVGPAVTDLKVGNLVVPTVRRPCPHPECHPCRTGHQDFCVTGNYTERGIKERHGFMAEYVVDDVAYLNTVPSGLRDVAVLVEPLTIAAKALPQALAIMRRLPWIEPHDLDELHAESEKGASFRALVLGAGAVGLLATLALRMFGFESYVYNRAPAPNPKSQLVESIGAHYIAEQSAGEFAHLIGDVDLVFEAAGASQLAFRAMKVLGPNGTFIFTGVPPLHAPSDVDTDAIMRNMVLQNQVMFGTVNAGKAEYETAIRELATITRRWPEAVLALITARYPLDAYRELLQGEAHGIKNVLSLDVSARQRTPLSASSRAG